MAYELVVNLWARYDSKLGFIYSLSGMAYHINGTDAEKLSFLQQRSPTDYINAKRYKLPDTFSVTCPDGTVLKKVTKLILFYEAPAKLFENVFCKIEEELHCLPHGSGVGRKPVPKHLPKNILYAATVLYESELGVRPIVNGEDEEWVVQQENARGRTLC